MSHSTNWRKKIIGGKVYDMVDEISGHDSDLHAEDRASELRAHGYLVRVFSIGNGYYEIFARKKVKRKGGKHGKI